MEKLKSFENIKVGDYIMNKYKITNGGSIYIGIVVEIKSGRVYLKNLYCSSGMFAPSSYVINGKKYMKGI